MIAQADITRDESLYLTLKRYGRLIKSFHIDNVYLQIFRTYDGSIWLARTTNCIVLEVTNLCDM